jgi:hypothetical protein
MSDFRRLVCTFLAPIGIIRLIAFVWVLHDVVSERFGMDTILPCLALYPEMSFIPRSVMGEWLVIPHDALQLLLVLGPMLALGSCLMSIALAGILFGIVGLLRRIGRNLPGRRAEEPDEHCPESVSGFV